MGNRKIKPQAFLVQLVASFSVAYLTTLIGYVFAWPSYTLSILTNETTPLEKPMTPLETTLLGSLTNLGAFIATPLCGIVIEKLGRRYAAMLFGLPFVLTWAIISVTRSINMVLFAMFFAGFGAAGQVVASVYISEIVQDSVRGALSTSMVAGYFVGVLISYCLGGNLSYHHVVYTHLVLSILYLIMMLFLKESPTFLVQNGRDEDAANSISFYRRIPPNSKEVLEEIGKIKRLLDPRIDKILQSQEDAPEFQSLNEKEENPTTDELVIEEVNSWKFLLNSPSSKRALFASLFLITVSIFMGAIILQVYAEPVLQTAVPSMSSNLCAIALTLVFLISSLISATLTDRYGRKPITTWSSIITGISCLLLGLQIQLQFAPAIFTVLLIFLYCFAFNIGAATTPFVFTAEAFLPEVKSLCNSITLGCMWLMNFIFLLGFLPIVDAVGLGGTFYIFCSICAINAFYSHFILPETKGLPVDEIQKLFYRKSSDARRHSKNQV